MLFGKKLNQFAMKFGSKAQPGKTIGHKNKSRVGANNIPQGNHQSAHIPDTKVISHDNNGFDMRHRYQDNSYATHNINRGSHGDKMSLERQRRQHKEDISSQFH